MKSFETGNIKWYVVDEGLKAVLQGMVFEQGTARAYLIADFKGRKIFIKSFVEKGVAGFIRNRVASRGKREFDLGRQLISLSVSTPEPLGYGLSGSRSYIIQELVEGESLLELVKESGDRSALLKELAHLLRTLTHHHIRHNDLHLGNILSVGNRLFLIDLHKMQIKKGFSTKDEISNLSHILVALYQTMTEEDKAGFFSCYGSSELRLPVERELKRLEEQWVRNKKQRAAEETSLIVRDGEFIRFKDGVDPEAGSLVEVVKDDKKVRVERWTTHIRKIYRGRDRLKRAWENHVVLGYMGLPVSPRAYAMKRAGFSRPGYIAMEDLGGRGIELDRFLDREYDAMDSGQRRSFVNGFADFFITLFNMRIIHRDMKGCNFFALKDGGLMLLDMEDILFAEVTEPFLKRMLLQLNSTVPKRICIRDRARFFLRLTRSLRVDRKKLFRDLIRDSAGREIVYEGVGGLKRERF